MASHCGVSIDGMSTWFSRANSRIAALLDFSALDFSSGSWRRPEAGWDGMDADIRRLRQDLDAVFTRFPDERCTR